MFIDALLVVVTHRLQVLKLVLPRGRHTLPLPLACVCYEGQEQHSSPKCETLTWTTDPPFREAIHSSKCKWKHQYKTIIMPTKC